VIYQAQSDQLKHALMNLPITYTILHLYAVQKLAGSQLNLPIMRIFQMTLDNYSTPCIAVHAIKWQQVLLDTHTQRLAYRSSSDAYSNRPADRQTNRPTGPAPESSQLRSR